MSLTSNQNTMLGFLLVGVIIAVGIASVNATIDRSADQIDRTIKDFPKRLWDDLTNPPKPKEPTW